MARILIVDDDPATLDVIEFSFIVDGHETLTAQNGEEAIALAIQERPDVIVLDSTMPVMDGLSATRVIRRTAEIADIPILMLSANATDADVWAGWQAGVSSYITKPLDLCVLKDELTRIGIVSCARLTKGS